MRALILMCALLGGCAGQTPVRTDPVDIGGKRDFRQLGVAQVSPDKAYRFCDECPVPSGKALAAPVVAPSVPAIEPPAPNPAPDSNVRKWTIHFALGRATVEDGNTIREIAAALAANPRAAVFVSGHTDALGSPGYNRKLADRRARSVLRALRRAGVDAQRIHIDSLCCIDNPPIANPPARKAAVVVYLGTEGK